MQTLMPRQVWRRVGHCYAKYQRWPYCFQYRGCPERVALCCCSGILVTGTVVLEALSQCGTAAFDKTGTLTTGQLAATSMRRPDAAAAGNGVAPQHSGDGGEKH